MKRVLALVVCMAACGGKVALDTGSLDASREPDVEFTPPNENVDAGVADIEVPDVLVDTSSDSAGQIIAQVSNQPMRMVQDATFLYWTQGYAPGEVAKVSKQGGTPVLLATNQAGPFGIAVDSTSIYWVEQGLVTSSGVIMKMDLDGGSPTALAYAQAEPVTLAIDASHVYWTNFGWQGASTIMRADLDGANATTIGTGSNVSWIAVGGGYVWWAGTGWGTLGATVTRAELDGANPTVMLTTTGGFNGIAVDSVNLYAADRQTLMSVPIQGGAVTTLATYKPIETDTPIVSDGANLYWSVTSGLQVEGLDGGAATVLAASPLPVSLVVDAKDIYWLSDFPQAISRLAKP